MMAPMKREDICVISSSGGHLTEALAATTRIKDRCVYISSNDEVAHLRLEGQRAFFILNFHRNAFLFLLNGAQSALLVARLRPRVVITTGAGMVVPFAILSRMIGARLIFIETAACTERPSGTGRILGRFASKVFVQWQGLMKSYPGAIMGGPLF
jgi:UDP-N-acetylglucosamine:LPS N-acetylglucosamine transferase